jgi:hypothetical protein
MFKKLMKEKQSKNVVWLNKYLPMKVVTELQNSRTRDCCQRATNNNQYLLVIRRIFFFLQQQKSKNFIDLGA